MLLETQYQHVRSSREVLINYCSTVSPSDFLLDHSTFGRGSIRNLLVHIGNTYEFWIGKQALQKPLPFTEYDSIKSANEVATFFVSIDKLMDEFLSENQFKINDDFELNPDSRIVIANPIKLFTHVITHEFHHKGQILSLSRHLGYIPIDTDVMR